MRRYREPDYDRTPLDWATDFLLDSDDLAGEDHGENMPPMHTKFKGSPAATQDLLWAESDVATYHGLEPVHPNRYMIAAAGTTTMLPISSLVAVWVGVIGSVCKTEHLDIFSLRSQVRAMQLLDRMYYLRCMGYVAMPREHLWRIQQVDIKALTTAGMIRSVHTNPHLVELTDKGIDIARFILQEYHVRAEGSVNGLLVRFQQLADMDRSIRAAHGKLGVANYPVITAYPGEITKGAMLMYSRRGRAQANKSKTNIRGKLVGPEMDRKYSMMKIKKWRLPPIENR